jgi:hypothetical protein
MCITNAIQSALVADPDCYSAEDSAASPEGYPKFDKQSG